MFQERRTAVADGLRSENPLLWTLWTTIIRPHLSQGEAVSADTFQPSLAQSEEVEKQSVNGVFNRQ